MRTLCLVFHLPLYASPIDQVIDFLDVRACNCFYVDVVCSRYAFDVLLIL